jgi:murein DD-endopeptidase
MTEKWFQHVWNVSPIYERPPRPDFRDRHMNKQLITAAILALVLPIFSAAETHSGFPVDILAGPPPQPVTVNGRTVLVYELHLTNYASLPIDVRGIEVFGDGADALASYRGHALDKAMIPVEKLSSADEPPTSGGAQAIAPGHSVLIFVDLVLNSGAAAPAKLRHQFSFSVPRQNKAPYETTLISPIVSVVQDSVPLLHAPLRGTGWIAYNAFSNGASGDHRRALNAFDGRERIPQRFAIDWVRIDSNGNLFHGDTKSNENFYAYGAEVLAVADGRVSDLKDGLPENEGSTERDDRTITLDNAVGNYVTLDLGHGRFAVYAHLQPRSFKVKLGDKVRAGQVLALLGNSGNSDAPHLHFQLVDANSPFGSEGIPYELESFTELGVVTDSATLDAGQASWQPKPGETPVVHPREFPADKAVVVFP